MKHFIRSFRALSPYPLARLCALRKLHAWLDTHRAELGDLVARSAASASDSDDAKKDGALVTRLSWALAKLCAHSRDAAVSALAAQCLGAVGTLPPSMFGDAVGDADDDDDDENDDDDDAEELDGSADESGGSEWLPVDVKHDAMRSVLRNLHRLVVEAPPRTVRKAAVTARALFRDPQGAVSASRLPTLLHFLRILLTI